VACEEYVFKDPDVLNVIRLIMSGRRSFIRIQGSMNFKAKRSPFWDWSSKR